MVREGFKFKPTCWQTGFHGIHAQLQTNVIYETVVLAKQPVENDFSRRSRET
jgi:hypothetical protein